MMNDEPSSTAAPDDELQEILNKAADALGGRELLAGIQGFLPEGTLSLPTGSGLAVCGAWSYGFTVVAESRSDSSITGNISVGRVCSPVTGNWLTTPDALVLLLPPNQVQDGTGLLFLLTSSWLFDDRMPGTVRLISAGGGAEPIVLETIPEQGSPCRVFLSPKTYLAMEIRLQLANQNQIEAASEPEDTRSELERSCSPTLFGEEICDAEDALAVETAAEDALAVETAAEAGEPGVVRFILRRWQKTEGLSYPSRVRRLDPGGRRTVYRVQEISLNPLFPTGFFDRPQPPPIIRFPAGATSVTADFRLLSNNPFLAISIDGQGPQRFALDTGTSSEIIDRRSAARLGLETLCRFQGTVGGGGDPTVFFLGQGVEYEKNGLGVRTHNNLLVSLTSLAQRTIGQTIDGIWGSTFIGNFVTVLDYMEKQVTFHQLGTYEDEGSLTTIPIDLGTGVPIVELEIGLPTETVRARMMLDTGNALAAVFTTPFVKEYDLLKEISPLIWTVGSGLGGQFPVGIGRIPFLCLAGFHARDPVVALPVEPSGTLGSTDHVGLLGAEYLKRMHLVFDYSQNQLSLAPNAMFDLPYEYGMSGLVIVAEGMRFRAKMIDFVIADSPGSEAGLQEGDRILAIDGKSASEMPLWKISELFLVPDRVYEMRIRRQTGAEEEFDVALRTRPLI